MHQLEQLHSYGIPLGIAAVEHIDTSTLYGAAAWVFVTLTGCIGTWLVARTNSGPSAQTAMVAGFQAAFHDLQTVNGRLSVNLDAANRKLDEQAVVINRLEGEMRTALRHIDRLERALTDAGASLPDPSNRA